MFKENSLVTCIGIFQLATISEEYLELDPFERGHVELNQTQVENGFIEVTEAGTPKAFDGFTVGDFFQLNGTFQVVRSNDVFTKIMVGSQMISVPNHKLMEVADND